MSIHQLEKVQVVCYPASGDCKLATVGRSNARFLGVPRIILKKEGMMIRSHKPDGVLDF